jgi:hypothetical protein
MKMQNINVTWQVLILLLFRDGKRETYRPAEFKPSGNTSHGKVTVK